MKNRVFLALVMAGTLLLAAPASPSISSAAAQVVDDQERLPHPPVAGLGDSRAAPAGTPMRLSLRAGWQLVSIRGGSSDAYLMQCMFGEGVQASPECAFARGLFEVTLRFQRTDTASELSMAGLVQQSDQEPLPPPVPLEPLPPPVPLDPLPPPVPLDPLPPPVPLNPCAALPQWSGWVLQSSGDGQNVWVPVWTCLSADGSYTILQDTPRGAGATLSVARATHSSPDTYELTVGGFCLNVSRSAPSEEHEYSLGVLTDDAVLTRILDSIRGKRLSSVEDRVTLQDVLWIYTEGEQLTDADWAALAALS